MAGIELSPAKHKAASAKLRQQRTMRSVIDAHVRPKRGVAIVAEDSFDWEAKGGKVERIPSTFTEPTRYPRPSFVRGKGGIG